MIITVCYNYFKHIKRPEQVLLTNFCIFVLLFATWIHPKSLIKVMGCRPLWYWRPNHKLFIGLLQIKQSQNKKGTKMVSFFTVNRWEKNTIFGAAEKKIGSSYFDRAWVANSNKYQVTHTIYVNILQKKTQNRHHVWNAFISDTSLIWGY